MAVLDLVRPWSYSFDACANDFQWKVSGWGILSRDALSAPLGGSERPITLVFPWSAGRPSESGARSGLSSIALRWPAFGMACSLGMEVSLGAGRYGFARLIDVRPVCCFDVACHMAKL